ncbi:MAG: acyltransferase [Clostridiales bacterium]|nr:acyltransferase [Clostridiales bacterium]
MSLINKWKLAKNPVKFWRDRGMKIGSGCEIYSSANFGSEPYLITVGDHVRINSGVKFVTHDGGVWVLRGMKEELKNVDMFGRITVGNNVHIGTDAIIMPGVTIGNNCIIGCGAIVTKSIPDNSVAVGVPARVLESIEEYEAKNADKFMYTKGMSREEKAKYLQENLVEVSK